MLAVEASDEAPAEGVAERLVVRICVVVIGVKLTAWLALIGYGLWHLISD